MKTNNSSWKSTNKKLTLIKEIIYIINYLNTTIREMKDRNDSSEIVSTLEERRLSLAGDLTHLTNHLKFEIDQNIKKDISTLDTN